MIKTTDQIALQPKVAYPLVALRLNAHFTAVQTKTIFF